MTVAVTPTYIDFVAWTRQLFIDFPALNMPIAYSEDDWQSWAARLIEENQLTTIPVPYNFEHWRTWAEYFVNNVQNSN